MAKIEPFSEDGMEINVVKNATRNVAFGFLNKIILLVCPFIERMVLLRILGDRYLGLGSLFSSIISVLNLTELGFGTAVFYIMCEPAARGDIGKANAILSFYRKAYRIIGCVILAVGLLVIPVLPGLIHGTYPSDINIVKLYLIYLGNTALSFFLFAYMQPILVVYQRNDIKSSITSALKISLTALQIMVLFITENYYLVCLLMPVFTILDNLLTWRRIHRYFPQYKAEGSLDRRTKAELMKLVSGTFIMRACVKTRNSLDSICISAFSGLALTAVYGNYMAVLTGVNAIGSLITTSFAGGIGNHVAVHSVEQNYNEMKKLDFLYLWIGGWCMICMLCMCQPFMKLWMGKDMLLPFPAAVLFCIYFYLLKLGDVRTMYTTANGLWWEQRNSLLIETILNVTLNILLGKFFGIYGIILATMISLFLCNYIWSSIITFRLYFSLKRLKDYYLYQGKQSLLSFAAAVITYGICISIPVNDPFLQILINMMICLVVPNTLFCFIYRNTDQFKYARDKLLAVMVRKK